jgi:predicted nucleotidyltransferase
MQYPKLVHTIVDRLMIVKGIQAIVLGGSWASGDQRPDSDIDLGLYYREDQPLDIQHIRAIATELNDFPNPVVTGTGEWGKWVNGGAWLTIEGQRVDFLYRSSDFVASIINDCLQGNIQFDGLQQVPYGFHSYIYCAETQICHILYDPGSIIQTLKAKVAHYPQPLKRKIINAFLWDASFAFEIARKSVKRGEVYFIAGCLTRIVSDLSQVLYALNETYFISDKRLYPDEQRFAIKPVHVTERIDSILGTIGNNQKELEATLSTAQDLLAEMKALVGEHYIQKFELSL